jgi:hypothetical protein
MRNVRLVFLFLVALSAAPSLFAQSGPYSYYALNPCRVIDTRTAPNAPALSGGQTRNFAVRGKCGVPTTAKVVSVNVTVTGATSSSFLTLWPSGGARPLVSTINFDSSDPAVANGAIVPLSTAANDLSVFNSGGAVHFILDVTGYFQ